MVPEHSSKWLPSRANETEAKSQQALWQALCRPASTSLSGPLLLRAFHCSIFHPCSYNNQIFFFQTVLRDAETSDWLRRKGEINKKKNQNTNIFIRKTLLKGTVRKKIIFICTNRLWIDKLCYVCHATSLATSKWLFWRGKTSLFLTEGQNDLSWDWCRPYMNTTVSIIK